MVVEGTAHIGYERFRRRVMFKLTANTHMLPRKNNVAGIGLSSPKQTPRLFHQPVPWRLGRHVSRLLFVEQNKTVIGRDNRLFEPEGFHSANTLHDETNQIGNHLQNLLRTL